MNKKIFIIILLFFAAKLFCSEQAQKAPNDLFALDFRQLQQYCREVVIILNHLNHKISMEITQLNKIVFIPTIIMRTNFVTVGCDMGEDKEEIITHCDIQANKKYVFLNDYKVNKEGKIRGEYIVEDLTEEDYPKL